MKGGLGSVVAHPLLADLTSSNNGTPSNSRGGTPGLSTGGSATPSGGWKGGRSGGGGKYAPMVPKFTSVKANARFAGTVGAGAGAAADDGMGVGSVPRIVQQAPSLNPYLSAPPAPTDPSTPLSDAAPVPYGETAAAAARRARPTLKFIQKGKYINKAEQLRKDQKLEELRQRIAENARKVGLESEFDILERNVRRQPPPEVEWWDAPLLRNGTYEDLDADGGVREGTTIYDEGGEGRLVTLAFVQHPIPIPAPWEGKEPQARGLMLTKKVSSSSRRGSFVLEGEKGRIDLLIILRFLCGV
jgi:U4/U6 small nuclear ribonucleoprotein PRP3